jgi:hypothetical protein
MMLNRAARRRAERERRRAAELRARLIDPACPEELAQKIHAQIGAQIARRSFEFHPGDSVHDVLMRDLPELFAIASDQSFVLSFDHPENSPVALSLGHLIYSVRRAFGGPQSMRLH